MRHVVRFSIAGAMLLAMAGMLSPHGIRAQAHTFGCPLAPVTVPLFDATPAAAIVGASATPASLDDSAQPATSNEAAAFEEALDDFVACINTGEAALVYAIFTQRYLASWFADPNGSYQPAFERMIAEGVSGFAAATPLRVTSVENVQARQDGRLSGQVLLTSAGVTWRDTLVLAQVDGMWLIDDVIRESR